VHLAVAIGSRHKYVEQFTRAGISATDEICERLKMHSSNVNEHLQNLREFCEEQHIGVSLKCSKEEGKQMAQKAVDMMKNARAI